MSRFSRRRALRSLGGGALGLALATRLGGKVDGARADVQGAPSLTHGVASGDVDATSAVIWSRADQATRMYVEVRTSNGWQLAGHTVVDAASDFTGKVDVERLLPDHEYAYRVSMAPSITEVPTADAMTGRFRTAPRSGRRPLKLLWASDLGGHGHLPPFPILGAMADEDADFAVFVGDTIYADTPEHYYATGAEHCPTPASTLDEFRCKYKELRVDTHLRRLLASTSCYAIWDDHEVTDNFVGPDEPLMPTGRQAFFEYWPIATSPDDPHRLYRSFPWGDTAELFILDNRQYRDPNTDPDSTDKSMLGAEQLNWLLRGLARSTAAYKLVVTSVPISIPTLYPFARDGWASGPGGVDGTENTGFETELRHVLDVVAAQSNVYFLTADVHWAAVIGYDPDHDGKDEFREFVTGPLAALQLAPQPLDPTFNPRQLYGEGEFYNYGVVEIDESGLTVTIKDDTGTPHFSTTFPEQP